MEYIIKFEETSNEPIDQVIYLQHYKEGWGERYEHKYEKRKCNDERSLYKKEESLW